MHERKRIVHNAVVSRGQAFSTSRTEAISPAATTSISARSLELTHSKVGANQMRPSGPTAIEIRSR